MECMVRLVRLGVGGNFFHTLEPKTFFVGSVFVLTSFIGFVITMPSASTMHPPSVSALNQCIPSYEISVILKNVVVAAFHLVFTAFIEFSSSAFYLRNVHRRIITSLPASSFETSFQFPFSSFHSFVSTSNQIGSPSSPNFPMIIFIAIGGAGFSVRPHNSFLPRTVPEVCAAYIRVCPYQRFV